MYIYKLIIKYNRNAKNVGKPKPFWKSRTKLEHIDFLTLDLTNLQFKYSGIKLDK